MDIQARADKLAHLFEERLDVRGKGFAAKVRRAGRLVPRTLRRDTGLILRAMEFGRHPRLARQIDFRETERAADRLEAWLREINPWERRWNIVLGWLAGNAFNLLAVAALVMAVLVWRGLL